MARSAGALTGSPSRPRPATARSAGAYDYEGERIRLSGPTRVYRCGRALEFHFCPDCACVAAWRVLKTDEDGRRRIAVNLRLAEPQAVAAIVIDHFDGLDTFDDLPRDGRCVRDYWF